MVILLLLLLLLPVAWEDAELLLLLLLDPLVGEGGPDHRWAWYLDWNELLARREGSRSLLVSFAAG